MANHEDPLEVCRRRRDRLRLAAARAAHAYDYAGASARGGIARLKAYEATHPDSVPEVFTRWVAHVEATIDEPNLGLGTFITAMPWVDPESAAARYGSTIWNWAGRRQEAATMRPNLERKLARAQDMLDAAAAALPAPPPDEWPADPEAPVTDEEADAMLDGAHEAWQAFGTDDEFRCGEPTVGHGHVGRPCRNVLGEDGACQDHP
ncbi:MAG: hypothetical protein AB7H88_11900 [Vicinamibacterales bacterium]